jgi:hypothetical protein
MIYGSPGIGKTTLTQLVPDAVTIDLDHETDHLPVDARYAPRSWEEALGIVRSDIKCKALILENASKATKLMSDFVVRTRKHEKGHAVSDIEGYGFGKGYKFIHDEWTKLLEAFDALTNRGVHVVIVAHETIENTPNPVGDDYIKYKPLLPVTKACDTRSMVMGWCTDVFYLSFDTAVEDGKGKGGTTRTIYGTQTAAWMAKSRPARKAQTWNDPTDNTLWKELLK